jgi:hypothetical protein
MFGLAFAAVLTWIAWKIGGRPWALIAVLIAAPTFAWAISRPLIEVMHEGFTWVANQPLERWEGNYYEFASTQVRIFEHRGELWFVAADVIKATGIAANADSLLAVYSSGCLTLENLTCLTMPTLEKLILANPGAESGRFLLWARREVIAPWEKKIGV